MYNRVGHPRARLTEKQIDEQVLAVFARIRQPDAVRDWFSRMLRFWSQDRQTNLRRHADEIKHEQAVLATRVFELSQSLTEQWLIADYGEKRQILEMVF